MARRKQIPISMSNTVLKGNLSKGIESDFKGLGEKGIATYFMLLQMMSGCNKTWTTINLILSRLDLQKRDKKNIIESLNFLIDRNLIFGNKISSDININAVLEFEIETDLSEHTYTTFYPNNFDFCGMIGVKGFSLFCVLESFAGTNNQAYCSIETLVKVTSFSDNTIMKYIYILDKLNIFNVEYGEYNPILKRRSNNIYNISGKDRIDLLNRDTEDIKSEVEDIIKEYENNKDKTNDSVDNEVDTINNTEELSATASNVRVVNILRK